MRSFSRGSSDRRPATGDAHNEWARPGERRADLEAMAEHPWDILRPLDVDRLARDFRAAEPFPHICIDGLLEPRFAAEVAASYPSFEQALELGRSFDALNESLKVQICDTSGFPEPVARLNAALASPEWLEAVATISGIPKLVADEELANTRAHNPRTRTGSATGGRTASRRSSSRAR